jgi:hypothetical protein
MPKAPKPQPLAASAPIAPPAPSSVASPVLKVGDDLETARGAAGLGRLQLRLKGMTGGKASKSGAARPTNAPGGTPIQAPVETPTTDNSYSGSYEGLYL